MTTKELIRAEIKKLQDIFVETAQGMETEDEATVYSMCAVEFGNELLSFLDTLEEPVSEDLEDEIDRVIADYSFTKTIDSGGFKTTVLDYAKIARHFYELGRNTGKEDKK